MFFDPKAIASAKVHQEQCLIKFQQSIEEINTKNVEEIRTLYKSLISEILEANGGVENIVIESLKDITTAREQLNELNNKLRIERDTNVKIMKSLIEGVGKTTKDLDLANFPIKNSLDILNKTRLSIKSFDKRVILVALMSFLVFLTNSAVTNLLCYSIFWADRQTFFGEKGILKTNP